MQRVNEQPLKPVWKRLFPLMWAHFVNDFYANVLPALLPLLKAKFDLSLALIGLASTLFTGAASITQLAFGWLGDRLQRVNFVVWGPAFTGVFVATSALMPNYALLLLTLMLAGLGSAMFHPQATAIAGSLIKQRRGLVISLFIAGGTVGFSLSPVVAALLFETAQRFAGRWEIGGWLLLVIAVACFVALRLSVLAPPVLHRASSPKMWSVLKPLLTMWLIVVLRHAAFLSLLTYLIILLQQRGWTYQQGSVILTVFLLGGAVGSLAGGALSDRFGRKRTVVLSLALAYPCLWAFLHGTDWIALVGLTLSGVALAINNPVIVAHAQELMPDHASTASAITMGLGWGTGSLIVSLVGLVADRWGIVFALDIVSAATLLAALLAFFTRAQPPEQRSSP